MEVNFEMIEGAKWVKNPLSKWCYGNLKAILANLRYRLLFLLLDGLLIALLFYLLSYTLEYTRDLGLANQLFALVFYVPLFFLPALYGYRSVIQILCELDLNLSINRVRRKIERTRRQERDFRALQIKINNLRISLKDFLEYSEVISPPIYGYELNRLQKGIDIFFNSISEVLFSKPNIFSRAQKIEKQQTLDYYESVERPTEEELAEEFEAIQKEEMGEIYWFDYYALDEFLQYLGDTLFAHTEVFSPFSFRHPIDLITLSRFFEHWNSIVSSCKNCKRIFEKAKKDVEEYYKLLGRRESQRRQRRHRLIDGVVVVFISVFLSAIISYLIR